MPTYNLPAQSTPFVGRQPELAEISSLLTNSECRLLTLVGPGGMGKTRLAMEAANTYAHDVRTQYVVSVPSFPDGVYFVPLQPLTSPNFIVPAIAEALNFQFYSGREPRQQLLDYLREKSLLLLLDNFEHLLDGVGIIADILTYTPGIKILTTSRERLNLREEWILNVEGLSFPTSEMETDIGDFSAVQLFVHHARRVMVGFHLTATQKPVVTRICRLVGGMPLGIELATAWVRALPVEEIAAEIERSLDILETPARNVEQRHRTMRAAFEPTWARITDDERGVFKKLSVFRGGFTREAAEYVAGASLRTLSALVDKSLLRADANGRYDIHELLRQYGEEQLSPEEHEQTRNLHCIYYADFMQQQWPNLTGSLVKEALDEIEQELSNVRAAWQWAVERKQVEAMDKFLDSLWFFYSRRGWKHEIVQEFGRVVETLGEVDDKNAALLARVMIHQGQAYNAQDKGKMLLEDSLAIARRVNARREIALALLRLGSVVNLTTGEISDQHRECLALFQEIGDHWGAGIALQMMCYSAIFTGHHDDAWTYGHESLALFRNMGNRERISAAQTALSAAALYSKRYEESCHFALESMRSMEGMVTVQTKLEALRSLAFASLEFGDQRQAREYAVQAMKIAAERQDMYFLLWVLAVLERIYVVEGQIERAVEIASLVDCAGKESAIARRPLTPYDYPGCHGELSPEVYAAAVERGQSLDPIVVVKELLTEWSQPESSEALSANTLLESDLLTARELQILQLVADGLSNREIAEQLILSVSTIKWYLYQIFSKLAVASRTQATARARTLGLLS